MIIIKKIDEIRKRKRIPVFVGGTGLYYKALTEGLVNIPNIPIRFRNKIRFLHETLGQKKFYKKLLEICMLLQTAQANLELYEL